MSDTDVIVETMTRCSILDRLPSDFGNPDATDLDRLAASLDYLALSCCEPEADEVDEHPPLEDVADDEQLRIDAAPAAGEQGRGAAQEPDVATVRRPPSYPSFDLLVALDQRRLRLVKPVCAPLLAAGR